MICLTTFLGNWYGKTQFSLGCKPNLPLSLTILAIKVKHVKEFDEVAYIRIRLRIYAASL